MNMPQGPSGSHRTLVLPGWQDSGAAHWQTRWQALHPQWQRVQQDDWMQPRRGDWMARLEEVLLEDDAPAVLVAHSLGCHLVAAWAAHSHNAHRVRAALLVAPPDAQRDDFPPQLYSWRQTVRAPLPFAATLVYSDDDPFGTGAAAQQLAADWRATPVALGARGHINGDSGLGDWPEGLQLLRELQQRAGLA